MTKRLTRFAQTHLIHRIPQLHSWKRVASVGVMSAVFLGTGTLTPTQGTTPTADLSATFADTEIEARHSPSPADLLSDPAFYEGLPVKDVVVHKAENAKGTVLYFPQYHRSPGSSVNDPANDKGEETQRQTYAVLSKIVEETPVRLMAVEGELAGDIADEKKLSIHKTQEVAREVTEAYEHLSEVLAQSSLNEPLETQALQEEHERLQQFTREQYLKGAPQLVWAEREDVLLVGTEVKATQDKSREIVREHIYLQDQIKRVSSGQSSLFPQKMTGLLNLSNLPADRSSLLKRLIEMKKQQRKGTSSGKRSLNSLYETAHAQGHTEITEAIERYNRAWQPTTRPTTAAGASARGADVTGHSSLTEHVQVEQSSSPSRSKNPFSHITNQSELKQLLKQNEEKIHHTVIERRNHETAETMRSAMERHEQDIAVLQFGAGHTEGLVKELVNQGLTVITVVPERVEL